MKDPEFLVVGTARAGTTALNNYLHQHPGLFLPAQKEPCFFSFANEKLNYRKGKFAFVITDKSKYQKLFRNASQGQITGEISTPYLFLHEQTINNIKRYHSDPASLKIVIILRNPVERAYSQYLWKVRDGREELSFEEALKQEKRRMEENYSFDYFYAHRGLYFEQVKNYLENFKNVKIILFEEFRNDFEYTMASLCEFLGVDTNFEFERLGNINSSFFPKFGTIGKLITVESKIKFKMLKYIPENVKVGMKETFNRFNKSNAIPLPIPAATKIYLQNFYRDDLFQLSKLTGLELNKWVNSD
jgi:hypothetical protein